MHNGLQALTVGCRLFGCGSALLRNDSAITETNPSLTLPHERIVFMQLGYVNDASLAASRLCTKVDPGWAATVGVSTFPDLANVVRVSQTQNSAGLAAKILDTPFSIGFLSPVVVKTRKANLINQAGKSVEATPATVTQATLELTANGILPGGIRNRTELN